MRSPVKMCKAEWWPRYGHLALLPWDCVHDRKYPIKTIGNLMPFKYCSEHLLPVVPLESCPDLTIHLPYPYEISCCLMPNLYEMSSTRSMSYKSTLQHESQSILRFPYNIWGLEGQPASCTTQARLNHARSIILCMDFHPCLELRSNCRISNRIELWFKNSIRFNPWK